jgi:hypothetical protein
MSLEMGNGLLEYQDRQGMIDRNDTIPFDQFVYMDGCTTSLLRSGVDGPHAKLADQLCSLNGRLYE